jgi:hypothetical protein
MSRDDETYGPGFARSNALLSERRGNIFIFIPFYNTNLLISLQSIFSRRGELGAGGGGQGCAAGGGLR